MITVRIHATHYDKTPGGHWHFESSGEGAVDDIKRVAATRE